MAAVDVHYELKTSPYSSHSLVIGSFPESGCGRTVLDLGCGNGYLAAILAERGYEVTGVERPGGFTDDFPPRVKLVVADLDNGIPALAGRFDYVLCADILEHLRNPAQILRQIGDVLKPQGQLIASLPNSGNLYFRLNVLFGRFPKHDKGLFDRTHLHFYVWDGWVELLQTTGYSVETCRPSGIPVGLALPSLDGTLPVRFAERLCYDAARLWKRLFAYQFIVTARRTERVWT
jgi:2-polyprenyl-3-methyl-5-hydroxy-6-metoxy-1,4-benzoquinol methylase